ncbi:ABC transporter transmembrane domain-containing protein [Magnetospirillum fulvum]|uniref:ABC transporter transmembrane domain-containing protein n=1 Tax=Magnetospirillum fulvum TaxID=1082 RepID=UPI0018C8D8B5|nr:ABC transporter transmembrane domain-containing protein [Magnetospirillum fulvum]
MSEIDDAPENYDDLATRHVSLRRILALFTPYRWRIVGIVALMFLASAVSLVGPFLLRDIIDSALPAHDIELLVWLVVGMVTVAMSGAAVGAWQVVVTFRIGQAVLHDLRVRLYSHLQSLSLRFFTGTRTGEVQSRIAGDIAGLQSLVTETASELGRALSAVVMTMIAIVLLDWRLALFVLFIVPGYRFYQQPRCPCARGPDLSAAGSRGGHVRRRAGDTFGFRHHPCPHHGPRSAIGATLCADIWRSRQTGGQVAYGGRMAMVADRVRPRGAASLHPACWRPSHEDRQSRHHRHACCHDCVAGAIAVAVRATP